MNRGQHFTRISTKTSHFTPSVPSKFLKKKLRKVKKSRGLDHVCPPQLLKGRLRTLLFAILRIDFHLLQHTLASGAGSLELLAAAPLLLGASLDDIHKTWGSDQNLHAAKYSVHEVA